MIIMSRYIENLKNGDLVICIKKSLLFKVNKIYKVKFIDNVAKIKTENQTYDFVTIDNFRTVTKEDLEKEKLILMLKRFFKYCKLKGFPSKSFRDKVIKVLKEYDN